MHIIRFIAATIAFAILSTFFVAYGTNTGYNGHFDGDTYWNSFVSAFGGANSFLAILVVLAILVGVFFALKFIGRFNRDLSYGIATLLVFAAAIIGASWIRVDFAFFGGIGPFLGFLVAAALATAIIGAILGYVPIPQRRRANAPVEPDAETTD